MLFTLPEGVAADKVTADFKDGILRVRLPKRRES
jgi:HSP20 family molecular chaperone IbpA